MEKVSWRSVFIRTARNCEDSYFWSWQSHQDTASCSVIPFFPGGQTLPLDTSVCYRLPPLSSASNFSYQTVDASAAYLDENFQKQAGSWPQKGGWSFYGRNAFQNLSVRYNRVSRTCKCTSLHDERDHPSNFRRRGPTTESIAFTTSSRRGYFERSTIRSSLASCLSKFLPCVPERS